MTHPGASWKARREDMGRSLDEVASALRVSRRFLRGIEEGNYSGFPERVFSTGFIRAYAKFLSVDPGPVLVEFEKTVELHANDEVLVQLAPEWLEREKERGSRKTTYTAAAGVVLALGVVLAWYSMRAPSPPPPRPVVEPPAAMAPAATAAANPAPPGENAARVAEGGDNAAVVPAAVDNASATMVSAGDGSGPLTGPFQLFLEASEHTWVMYSFDGGDPIDVTLYAGDKISIQATRQISLKIGNAAGVVGTLNGQRLPPFGDRGQVRKLTFGQ